MNVGEYGLLSQGVARNLKQALERGGLDDFIFLCVQHGHIIYSFSNRKQIGKKAGAKTALALFYQKVKNSRNTELADFGVFPADAPEKSAFGGTATS